MPLPYSLQSFVLFVTVSEGFQEMDTGQRYQSCWTMDAEMKELEKYVLEMWSADFCDCLDTLLTDNHAAYLLLK